MESKEDEIVEWTRGGKGDRRDQKELKEREREKKPSE